MNYDIYGHHYVAFTTEGSRIVLHSKYDRSVLGAWDSVTGHEVGLSCTNLDTTLNLNATISLDKDRFFTQLATTSYLGQVPIEISSYPSHHWKVMGSSLVGWTVDHKLILLKV